MTDSGTECSLSQFASDTKLSCAVDMAEVRDTIQKDLDKSEKNGLIESSPVEKT